MEQEVLRSDEIAVHVDNRNVQDCEPKCDRQGTYTGTVILEDYPNCPQEFSVDFCLTWENVFGRADQGVVNFSNLRWGGIITSSNHPDCQRLWADILNVIRSGNDAEIQAFLNDAYSQAIDQLTASYVEENLDQWGDLITCDEIASDQHFNLVRRFNTENCYQVCLMADGRLLRNPCGNTCCETLTAYCIDPDTGEIIEEVLEESETFGFCEAPNFSSICIDENGEGPVATGPCVQSCQ